MKLTPADFEKLALEQIDMLNWKAFERAIDVGYTYAREQLNGFDAGSANAGR